MESPRCKCGHRKYDHIGSSRCDEGSKRCRCMQFTAQPETDQEKSNGA